MTVPHPFLEEKINSVISAQIIERLFSLIVLLQITQFQITDTMGHSVALSSFIFNETLWCDLLNFSDFSMAIWNQTRQHKIIITAVTVSTRCFLTKYQFCFCHHHWLHLTPANIQEISNNIFQKHVQNFSDEIKDLFYLQQQLSLSSIDFYLRPLLQW